jgi:hypothetical protein
VGTLLTYLGNCWWSADSAPRRREREARRGTRAGLDGISSLDRSASAALVSASAPPRRTVTETAGCSPETARMTRHAGADK